ncbi:MAG: hypothetical protein JXQ23_12470, partial [Clostridia bacterium]|nr:hypothetical protein [Clostridia bacterium]
MPSDNIEVMDDFIVDMDIETITLDDLDLKDSASQADGAVSASESDTSGLSFEDSVQIDDINLSTMSFSPENVETVQVSGPSDISIQTDETNFSAPVESLDANIDSASMNIEQASFTGNVNVTVSKSDNASINTDNSDDININNTDDAKFEDSKTPLDSDSESFEIPEFDTTMSSDESAISDETHTDIPEVSLSDDSDTVSVDLNNEPQADTDVIMSDTPDFSLEDIKSESNMDLPEFDVPDLNLTPEAIEENYTENLSDTVSIDETDSVFSTDADSNFSTELDQSDLDVIQEAQEPSIPEISEVSNNQDINEEEETTNSRKSHLEAAPIFDAEDDIISIDGSELDKIIYGESIQDNENSLSSDKQPPTLHKPIVVGTVPVVESSAIEVTDSMLEDIPEINDEVLIDTETMSEQTNVDEAIPLPEETISTEEPFSELETQTNNPELVLVEDNGEELTFDNTTDGILNEDALTEQENTPIQSSTEELLMDSETGGEKSPEFSFDLSVIPDVAEIE